MELGIVLIVLGIAVAMLAHGGLGALIILVGLLVLILPLARR